MTIRLNNDPSYRRKISAQKAALNLARPFFEITRGPKHLNTRGRNERTPEEKKDDRIGFVAGSPVYVPITGAYGACVGSKNLGKSVLKAIGNVAGRERPNRKIIHDAMVGTFKVGDLMKCREAMIRLNGDKSLSEHQEKKIANLLFKDDNLNKIIDKVQGTECTAIDIVDEIFKCLNLDRYKKHDVLLQDNNLVKLIDKVVGDSDASPKEASDQLRLHFDISEAKMSSVYPLFFDRDIADLNLMGMEYNAETYDKDMQELLKKINEMPFAPKEFKDLNELEGYLMTQEAELGLREEEEPLASDAIEFLMARRDFKVLVNADSEVDIDSGLYVASELDVGSKSYTDEEVKERLRKEWIPVLKDMQRHGELEQRAEELRLAETDKDIQAAKKILH